MLTALMEATEQPHVHAGNDANEVAVLLNIAHSTLMDEALRETYQSDVSPSLPPPVDHNCLYSSISSEQICDRQTNYLI